MALKYIFVVEYKGGTSYLQNEQDISISADKTKSCFFDVKQDEVLRFHLFNNENKFTVDLQDGHFEVNGVPFSFHEHEGLKYRLIFWREHTHTTGGQGSHEIVYLLGWQATKEGRNIKKIMRIK